MANTDYGIGVLAVWAIIGLLVGGIITYAAFPRENEVIVEKIVE